MGELVAIIGLPGVGKTTVFRFLAPFERPQGGTLEYIGTGIWQLSNERNTSTDPVVVFVRSRVRAVATNVSNLFCDGTSDLPRVTYSGGRGVSRQWRRLAPRVQIVD
ncbi:ATP-binding cassette domain-containing protein [Natronorubrum halalkaliphilum]|uniref:ATP-binding cassette domain-containing protein n=1 Tax=Natronorubrum halalkaliphilum TaxID=2691917 RepID=UPI0013575D4D